ncbi:CRAL TRIO domain-containing protein [Cytidiella melzeri]|nr:CRAL TRIO domain-containing protein [Cytidiella melzeri]
MGEKTVTKVAPPVPDLTGKTTPQGQDLSATQQKAADDVLAHFSTPNYKLPVTGEQDGTLTEDEKFWLTYECMLRYLRATKWHSSRNAIKRLEETLLWRREFGLYDERVTAANVEPEEVTGKQVVCGYDVDGRPALYLCPSRQNTDESIRQLYHLVFMLERCIDLMGPGVESLALMIDYGEKSSKSPSFAQSRLVLNILQTHYPERLGRALITNLPWLLNAFYKMITPLIDPVTKNKMRFNPKPVEDGLFTADNVWKEFGGEIDFQYVHEEYWPHFVKMTSERRETMLERWKALGGKVGLKEWDFKQQGIAIVEEEAKPQETDVPV